MLIDLFLLDLVKLIISIFLILEVIKYIISISNNSYNNKLSIKDFNLNFEIFNSFLIFIKDIKLNFKISNSFFLTLINI